MKESRKKGKNSITKIQNVSLGTHFVMSCDH